MSSDIKIGSNRSFGVVFFIFFLFIALYPLINDGEVRLWSLLISLIFVAANFYQEPTEKFSFAETNPYKWCFIIFSFGLADKILISLYTCMLSAFTISPFIFLAISMDSLDFPEAVGPNKRIIFL